MLRPEANPNFSLPRLVDLDTPAIAQNVETTVATLVGHASACDVWFRVPGAWETSLVVFRLYARVNDARVLVQTASINEVVRNTTAGIVSGMALSARGFPVTAFEVTVQPVSAALTAATGAIKAMTWAAEPIVPVPRVRPASFTRTPYLVTPVAQTAVALNAAANTLTNLLTITSGARDVLVQRVSVSFGGAAGGAAADGRLQVLMFPSPAPSTPTVSNTVVAATPLSLDDPAPTAQVRGVVAGSPFNNIPASPSLLAAFFVRGDSRDHFTLDLESTETPIILRRGRADTLLLRFWLTTVATSGTLPILPSVLISEV
jgi:hypothetical protein